MPATANPSAARARNSAAAARRAPLRRQLAFYDLSQPSPINAYTPGPAAPGATRGIPLTRQFAFYNVRTSGAFIDGAAAAAQTSTAAGVQQPSSKAGLGDLVAALLAESSKRKRTVGDVETGDAKRRRVGSDALPLSRAEGRQTAGKPSTSTGATATTHHYSTAAAASSAARDAPVTPTKTAGIGQTPRQIAKLPKRGGFAAPSTPPRRASAALPSGPPPAPEPKRVRGQRTGSGTNGAAKEGNESEEAPASA